MEIQKLGVLQPYFFPYIGYYQLIYEVDTLVFYDDVQFSKGSWVNRNRILINGEPNMMTIPRKSHGMDLLINEIESSLDDKQKRKLLNKITMSYSKAPFFKDVFPFFEHIIQNSGAMISDIAIQSIRETAAYLGWHKNYMLSSEMPIEKEQDRVNRLISMIKHTGATTYINPIGGTELYDYDHFKSYGIELGFLKSRSESYDQFDNDFVANLSMLDVLMFNSVDHINDVLIKQYDIVT